MVEISSQPTPLGRHASNLPRFALQNYNNFSNPPNCKDTNLKAITPRAMDKKREPHISARLSVIPIQCEIELLTCDANASTKQPKIP